MKNAFFYLAKKQALRLAGKRVQLLVLAVKAGQWLTQGQALKQLGEVRNEGLAMVRMVTAFAKGRYRNIPTQSLVGITAALIYFINPFDLIPDALIGFGLTDDAAVITWMTQKVRSDVQSFLSWERLPEVTQ